MKKAVFLIIVMVVLLKFETVSFGSDYFDEELGEYFDFDEIQKFLDETGGDSGLDFEEVVKEFMKGDTKGGADKFVETVKDKLFLELSVQRVAIKRIVALALIAAIFSNFARIFRNSQVSETGFIVCYVAVMTYLLGSFTALSYIAYEVIGNMLDFMKALLPVYAVSIEISGGQGYAVSFYEMALLIIGFVDLICLKVILPAIDIYVAVSMVNNLSKEDYLSKSCELIKSVVAFAVKGMLTVVLGLNVIQKMFSPVNATFGGNAAKNIISAISGIPGSGNGVAELLYGTGKVLKSSIGGAGLIVLCVLIMIPIVKILVFIFTYQLTNAVIQPVSDKRITGCVSCISEGAVLVLRTVFVTSVMFVVTITIVCM